MRRASRFFVAFLCLGGAMGHAEETALVPGSRLESLPVGPTTYHQVQVRSVNPRTLMITHSGGMASIRLRDLAPEWQARFHYDPVAAAATEQAARHAPSPVTLAAPKAAVARPKVPSRFEALLLQFGQRVELQAEVDLRSKFFRLELRVKDQGARPSCAVFAIVSALEFQNAELTGRVEKFSEEYLIWAVRKSVQRIPAVSDATEPDPDSKEIQDEGFTLGEVVAALRAYGIPRQSSMPNTLGRKIESIEAPPPATIKEAQSHQHVYVHQLPGRDSATRLNNLVQALNAGTPVAIGLAWPHYRSLRSAYLSGQKPMATGGHAVTLVGYRSATGRIEDAVFVFKNSWGIEWGQGGYGMVTYGYLDKYLHDAVLLEVRPD